MNKRIVITIIFALVLITVFGIDLFEIVFIEEEIPIYGDGLNIRDWLYVIDHCEAIDAALHIDNFDKIDEWQIFHENLKEIESFELLPFFDTLNFTAVNFPPYTHPVSIPKANSSIFGSSKG